MADELTVAKLIEQMGEFRQLSEEQKTIVVCLPEQEEMVLQGLEESGLTHLARVVTSPHLPPVPNRVYVIDPRAIAPELNLFGTSA